MRVALDLDGTLAQTYSVAFALMGVDHEYEDIESWEWGLNEFGGARFLNAMWHAWTLRPHDIKPIDDLRSVDHIYDLADELDVVTADPGHLGIKESKAEWLERQEVAHDELVISPKGQSKAELYHYDVFVDDNPHLVDQVKGDQLLLLYDAPYNQEDVSDIGNVIRVFNLWDATKEIESLLQVA